MKGLVCYNIFGNDKLLIPKSFPNHLNMSHHDRMDAGLSYKYCDP